MSRESEIYKLITAPDEHNKNVTYVDQFQWMDNTDSEFLIIIKYGCTQLFIDKLQKILGCKLSNGAIFDENLPTTNTGVCVNLSTVLENHNVDLNSVFPNPHKNDYYKAIIIKRLEAVLAKEQIKYKRISYLKWNDDRKTVQISLDDKMFGSFDYVENWINDTPSIEFCIAHSQWTDSEECALYELITNPIGDGVTNYVNEIKWVDDTNDKMLYVTIKYRHARRFLSKLQEILGCEFFDNKQTMGNLQPNGISINLSDIISSYAKKDKPINLDNIIPEERK